MSDSGGTSANTKTLITYMMGVAHGPSSPMCDTSHDGYDCVGRWLADSIPDPNLLTDAVTFCFCGT